MPFIHLCLEGKTSVFQTAFNICASVCVHEQREEGLNKTYTFVESYKY